MDFFYFKRGSTHMHLAAEYLPLRGFLFFTVPQVYSFLLSHGGYPRMASPEALQLRKESKGVIAAVPRELAPLMSGMRTKGRFNKGVDILEKLGWVVREKSTNKSELVFRLGDLAEGASKKHRLYANEWCMNFFTKMSEEASKEFPKLKPWNGKEKTFVRWLKEVPVEWTAQYTYNFVGAKIPAGLMNEIKSLEGYYENMNFMLAHVEEHGVRG